MYFIKRAFKYLKKKVGKTILLGIIFLVVANFVLAGLLVQNAAEQAQINARQTVGADISYTIDFENIFEDYQNGKLDYDGTTELRSAYQSGLMSSKSLSELGVPTFSNFMKIIDSEYVKTYYINVTTSIESSYYTNYSVDGSGGSSFELNAIINSEPYNFTEENSTLSGGRYPTQDEIINGSNVIMIDENIANLNNLSIGDTLTIEGDFLDHGETDVDYEIIGIFTSSSTQTNMRDTAYQNKLYTPYFSLSSFGVTDDELTYMLVNPTIVLSDPLYTDEYKDEAKELLGTDMKYGTLDADDDLYNQMVGSIETLGTIAKILVLIVAITGVVIIGLITALTANERKGEIGILLAIGETKLKIISQFVLEVVVIALIAFMLSIFTGSYLGDQIADYALDSDLLSNETQTTFMRSGQMMNGGQFPGGQVQIPGNQNQEFNENQTPGQDDARQQTPNNTQIPEDTQGRFENMQMPFEEITEETEIDISLNIESILLLFAIGLLLSAVSTAIPSLYVMRFNPKEILTNKDS